MNRKGGSDMERKKSWKIGYFPKELLLVKSEKACKIRVPSYSDYDGYIFWLPAKFVKPVLPNKEDFYEFFIPENFEIELRLESQKNTIIDRKKVTSLYIQYLFSTLSKAISERLGLGNKADFIDVASIRKMLHDEEHDSSYLATLSGLSRQTIEKVRTDDEALEGMKLKNLRLLQKVVATFQKKPKE